MDPEPTVAVGRIARPHGVTGEVAVAVLSEVPERFADGATVWLKDGRALTVESSRPQGSVLVRFREVVIARGPMRCTARCSSSPSRCPRPCPRARGGITS